MHAMIAEIVCGKPVVSCAMRLQFFEPTKQALDDISAPLSFAANEYGVLRVADDGPDIMTCDHPDVGDVSRDDLPENKPRTKESAMAPLLGKKHGHSAAARAPRETSVV